MVVFQTKILHFLYKKIIFQQEERFLTVLNLRMSPPSLHDATVFAFTFVECVGLW